MKESKMNLSSIVGTRYLRVMAAMICAAALAIGATACGGDDDGDSTAAEAADATSEQASTEPVETFKVMMPFPDSIIHTGYEIGQGPDGTFENDARLKPKTVSVDGNSAAIQQLVAGRVDFAVTGAPEIILANVQGHEIYGVSDYYSDVFSVLASESSGVTSVDQLKGKAIGVSDLSGGEMPIIRAVLADAGLEENKDVEIKVVGTGASAARALESGDIVAYGGAFTGFVPLESQGIRFTEILPDKFKGLPNDFLAVTADALDDPDLMAQLEKFQKARFAATIYGQQYPKDGLDRICKIVPSDCQDMEFAKGFYDATMDISIPAAEAGGCPDYEALTVVRDAIAGAETKDATDVDVEKVFPDTYCQNMIPTDEEVQAFAERTGATG